MRRGTKVLMNWLDRDLEFLVVKEEFGDLKSDKSL